MESWDLYIQNFNKTNASMQNTNLQQSMEFHNFNTETDGGNDNYNTNANNNNNNQSGNKSLNSQSSNFYNPNQVNQPNKVNQLTFNQKSKVEDRYNTSGGKDIKDNSISNNSGKNLMDNHSLVNFHQSGEFNSIKSNIKNQVNQPNQPNPQNQQNLPIQQNKYSNQNIKMTNDNKKSKTVGFNTINEVNDESIDNNNNYNNYNNYNNNNNNNNNNVHNNFGNIIINKQLDNSKVNQSTLTTNTRKSQTINKKTNPNLSMLSYANDNEYPKIIPESLKEDNRFTSYDLQMPMKYYYDKVKVQEPNEVKNEDWYLRPHHIETFSKNEKAIPDDILNTKYISYYGPANIPKKKTKQEELDEVIEKLHNKRENLQKELYTNMSRDENLRKYVRKSDQMEILYKQDYKPGMILDKFGPPKAKGTDDMFEGDVQYSEMFNKDDNVYQKNLVIQSYKCLIDDERDTEGKIMVNKRKQEFERIRPPKDKWWEEKSKHFIDELQRNKMVLNAQPEYFMKLRDLQDESLY